MRSRLNTSKSNNSSTRAKANVPEVVSLDAEQFSAKGRLPEKLRNDEIAISVNVLKPYFIGDAPTLAKNLTYLITKHSTVSAERHAVCVISGEAFQFEQRQTGARIVWSLSLSNIDRLAKVMNWQTREKKEPSTEIAALTSFVVSVDKPSNENGGTKP